MQRTFRAGLMAAVIGLGIWGGASLPVAHAQGASGSSATIEPAPLSAYGALPSLELMQLSPSGKKLAFITVSGEQRMLVLLDLATKAQLGGVDVGRAKVRDLEWVGEDRVLITTTKTETVPELGLFRVELFSGQLYDVTKGKIFLLLQNTRNLFPALFSTPRVVQTGSDFLVLVRAFGFDTPELLNQFSIDLESGRGRLHEVMGRRVEQFILDPTGKSLARSEYEPVSQTWSLQLRQDGNFRETWKTTAPIETPALEGLGLAGDSIIVLANRPDLNPAGRDDVQLFDVKLDTGAWRPLRFDFEPENLLFHPVTHRLIGATRTTDAGLVYAFADPAAQALSDNVQRAFAGKNPQLVSWSDDFRKAIVFTNHGLDSGTYYVVDLEAGKLTSAGAAYAQIRPQQVAPVRYITYTAQDGLEIHGFLTTPPGAKDLKNLPLVVLPHGGPEAHDASGFDWWSQALASRGYAVLQPNFRGSTGYSDAFVEAGYGEWGRKMQTDLSDGVRYLQAQGIVDPKRVCIVGASYGGYAALAGATLDKGVYRCAVSVAGVSDLRLMVEDQASSGVRRENQTTRYWNRFMGAEKLGDRSLDERSPARLAANVEAPILLIHGKDDSVVPIEQSRMMADALRKAGKPFEFIELNGEDHWLSRSETRLQMLTETVRFLQAHNPPG